MARAGHSARRRIERLWPLVRARLREVAVVVPEDRALELRLVGRFTRVDMGTQAEGAQDQAAQTDGPARGDRVHQSSQAPEYDAADNLQGARASLACLDGLLRSFFRTHFLSLAVRNIIPLRPRRHSAAPEAAAGRG